MQDIIFPDANLAPKDAPCCVGGNLDPTTLIYAYKSGYFPWFMSGEPILWWSPDPRAVIFPKDVRVQKSIRSKLKKYEVKFNQNFSKLINLCFTQRVKNEPTWLSKDIIKAYENLHDLGHAKSVEVYDDGELIGGLYGVMIGAMFCGESMISLKKDASKVALINLCKNLEKFEFLIDCQVMNSHLEFMGAKAMKRSEFLELNLALSSVNLEINFENFTPYN